MEQYCPFCKQRKKYLSDNKEFPRFIRDGKTIVSNIHRFYTFEIIECSNCGHLWLFRAIPGEAKNPAFAFYYTIDKDEFKNISKMEFSQFLDFCISELRGYKVGNYVERKIDYYLQNNLEEAVNIAKSRREIPKFIMEYMLEWAKKNNKK